MKIANSIQLSICIPTYNRPTHLENCLESIHISNKNCKNFKFEVCISDNGSKHNISKIIKKYSKKLNIKFNRFKSNLGIATNFLKVIEMAEGEFVWTLGNDDLLLPNSLNKISKLLQKKKIDYFFINSYNLKLSFLKKYKHPFSTYNLPSKMERFSKVRKSKTLNFWEMIDPEISFDFLLATFLNLFRRKLWNENVKFINMKNARDKRWYSTPDNTYFNAIIFANAFKNSKAYVQAQPLTVNLNGVREWLVMYMFIIIVRIPEMLDYYRSRGLPFKRYYVCKNFSLKQFFRCIVSIYLSKDRRSWNYLSIWKHILKNLIFVNVYLSPFHYLVIRIKRIFKF
jgi:glycosyltransferase involved in cell wall biosynthesis